MRDEMEVEGAVAFGSPGQPPERSLEPGDSHGQNRHGESVVGSRGSAADPAALVRVAMVSRRARALTAICSSYGSCQKCASFSSRSRGRKNTATVWTSWPARCQPRPYKIGRAHV